MIPELYILVGISASGKSSIRSRLVEERGAVICSSDDIRGEICPGGVADQSMNSKVFQLLEQRVCHALRENRNVVIDATNLKQKARKPYFHAVKNIPCRKIALVLTKPEEQCQADNVGRPYPVPDWVIRSQMRAFELPITEEGFDEIRLVEWEKEHSRDLRTVNAEHPFRAQIPPYAWGLSLEELMERMQDFDQKNRYHTMTLGQHCVAVSDLFEQTEYERCLKNAARIHDIGKLFTQTFDEEGNGHFYSHENVGAHFVLTHRNLVEATFGPMSDEEFLKMVFLINYHMYPMRFNTEKARAKYIGQLGEKKVLLLSDFHACDVNGK